MNIYAKDYRKIYENIHGPIPKDEDGRSYDIHHIDGNHENNDPSNLEALSIQEHYERHYEQKNWCACSLIILRMNKTPDEISEEISKFQLKKVEEGSHHWLKKNGGDEIARRNTLEQIKNGKNVFVGGEIQRKTARRLVKEGTHNLLKQNGGSEFTSMIARKLLAEGRHQSQQLHICPHCGKEATGNGMFRWHFDKCKKKTVE